MFLIRRSEEEIANLSLGQEIKTPVHLAIGQEAIAVGISSALTPADKIYSGHRGHAHYLALGASLNGLFAEVMGKETGVCKGMGGSMHLYDPSVGFQGSVPIVGGTIPIAVGAAIACKYENNGAIAVCYFGDGAANQGQVYESFNMAKLWELPCIYVIENNRYAMGTSVQRSSAQKDLSQRGISFGIEGEQVNGMDIESVIDAGKRAVTKVRNNGGPYILEMLTYRYRGHSMSDPAQYRTRDEVKEVREHSDPIESLKNLIIENNFLTEDKLQVLNAEIKQVVDQSAQYAADSPLPDPSELFVDVYQLDS